VQVFAGGSSIGVGRGGGRGYSRANSVLYHEHNTRRAFYYGVHIIDRIIVLIENRGQQLTWAPRRSFEDLIRCRSPPVARSSLDPIARCSSPLVAMPWVGVEFGGGVEF